MQTRTDIVANIYCATINDFIKNKRLNPIASYEKLLRRPNSVRVAKVANFQINGRTVSSILADNEELYEVTNKIYGHFRSLTEPQADKATVDEETFNLLIGEQNDNDSKTARNTSTN